MARRHQTRRRRAEEKDNNYGYDKRLAPPVAHIVNSNRGRQGFGRMYTNDV